MKLIFTILALVFFQSIYCMSPDVPFQSTAETIVQSRINACTEQYSLDMQSILVQFQNIAPLELNQYQHYMILRKQFEDLSFILKPYQRTLVSDERARLRTPLQHYNDCRSKISEGFGFTVETQNVPPQLLTPCEKNYAIEVQQVLDYYTPLVSQPKLHEYEDFMIMIKQFEDVRSKIRNFEKIISNDRMARLQFPISKYNNCRDAIIRTYGDPYGDVRLPSH